MSWSQANAPQKLDLASMMSALGQLGGFARSCRFAVVFEPQGDKLAPIVANNNLYYFCDAAEFPGRGFNLNEVRYYGPTISLPNNVQYNTANFSFLCRVKGRERQMFDDWMDLINPTSNWSFEYPNQYWGRIRVFQLGETPHNEQSKWPGVAYSWVLHNAWPVLVNPQQVTWADSDVLRLQVTFSYKYWDRPDLIK